MHLPMVGALALVLLILAGLTLVFLRRGWRAASRMRNATVNLSLMGFTVAFLLLALETYCYVSARPDGFAFTLASKRWHALFGGPTNSLGYRDVEHQPQDFANKRALFVVGDSFANGSGIDDYCRRFSNVLADKLGSRWEVVIISRGGWDQTHELEALRKYPRKPDGIVLQYYTNDILHAANQHGISIVPPRPTPPRIIQPLVAHSFLFDFIYWRMFRWHMQDFLKEFDERTRACYADESIWRDHEAALRTFAGYTQEHGIKLLVLVFPNLQEVELYRPITTKVAAVFEGMGVPVLDLTPVVAGRDPMTLVCNAFNGHPNEAFSREVGDLLYQKVIATFGEAP